MLLLLLIYIDICINGLTMSLFLCIGAKFSKMILKLGGGYESERSERDSGGLGRLHPRKEYNPRH